MYRGVSCLVAEDSTQSILLVSVGNNTDIDVTTYLGILSFLSLLSFINFFFKEPNVIPFGSSAVVPATNKGTTDKFVYHFDLPANCAASYKV